MNTHYAVIAFVGDPAHTHPDQDLRGRGPSLTLIAVGDEESCWAAAEKWTEVAPLRPWEDIEVLTRHPSMM